MYEANINELFGMVLDLTVVRDELEKKGNTPLDQQAQHAMLVRLAHVDDVCRAYEIDVSYFYERVVGKIHEPSRWKPTLACYVDDVLQCIKNELRKRRFFFMPPGEVEYYGAAALFGREVAERFPTANKETTEAGNCYATGLHTACVFHLMRAVEIGARRMMIELRAKQYMQHPKRPIELCDWQELVNALDKAVATLNVGTRNSVAKKARFEYYNHAVAQFRNFKDAWRNSVSHTRRTFAPGVTKDIMDNTRQFMQHLATKLKE